jgi:hypothetical protein
MIGKKDASSGGWVDAPVKPRDCRMYAWKTTWTTPARTVIPRLLPRISLSIQCTALAKRPLGRHELKQFNDWNDGQPGTELNFKFYRQATNKIAGISDEAAAFLGEFFQTSAASYMDFG